jgi:hypothetical protein
MKIIQRGISNYKKIEKRGMKLWNYEKIEKGVWNYKNNSKRGKQVSVIQGDLLLKS